MIVAYPSGALYSVSLYGQTPNITRANTLAYFSEALATNKKFYSIDPGGLSFGRKKLIKLFFRKSLRKFL
jgi:hypothetical protein